MTYLESSYVMNLTTLLVAYEEKIIVDIHYEKYVHYTLIYKKKNNKQISSSILCRYPYNDLYCNIEN